MSSGDQEARRADNFIEEIINEDNRTGKHGGRVVTRFPPEPNGYLHIGHAKSICLNFGTAAKYGGICHLRFDDTNPTKEEQEYVDAIMEDVRWLGFDWGEKLFFASDYFERLYDQAVRLIELDKAYVCELSAEEIREGRGTLTEPGRESPWRNRPRQENLDLFHRMRAGEFPDGSRTLRARIDMNAGNLNMRDPVIYRILRRHHHRTGDAWCIYPMYDFTHCLSDSIEGITHSLCTLEFEDHRPLYDWFLDQLGLFHPQQIEFARLELGHTVMSKRRLLQLVTEGLVEGWDDPRMPTITGLRRRGMPPAAIRAFCDRIGVAKKLSMIDLAVLEHAVREELNRTAARAMAVLDPLEVVLTDYPEERVEELGAANNPEDPAAGTRHLPFSRRLFIEREDFMEEPPRKFYRLAPGREVRLKDAYIICCREVEKDDQGRVRRLLCTHDPDSGRGGTAERRRVKGTLHWVSAPHALPATVRLYEHLFTPENPAAAGDRPFPELLNPGSLRILEGCRVEPSLAEASPEQRYQFMRKGYFCTDRREWRPGNLVFNRTVTLRDTWAKVQKKKG